MPGVVLKTFTKRYGDLPAVEGLEYQVQVLETDVVLPVTTPPPVRVAAGDTVTLAVALEACMPLAGGDGGPTRAAG